MFIKMNPDWVCDGMTDKEFTHDWCEKYCGKDSDYITPKCLHMYYHHIVRAEQTEPQTDEYCDYCKMTHKYWYEHCDICKRKPKTEPHHSGEVTEMVEPQIVEQAKADLEKRSSWSKTYEAMCKDEPQTDMAEDIVRSYGFKAESYQQAKAKDEPQTDEEYINNLPWTEVGNGEQTDCPWK